MIDLTILRPPHSLRSGDDILGRKTVKGLSKEGISCLGFDLWPEWFAKNLAFSGLPGARTLFDLIPATISVWIHRSNVRRSKMVWILGPSTPHDTACRFERFILRHGCVYIYHVMDDWFTRPSLLRLAGPRVQLASLVVVPTEPLRNLILTMFPSARVLVLEEPIDIERVKPGRAISSDRQFLVWTGSLHSLSDLTNLVPLLERVYARHPFRLRIVCGLQRPELNLPLPWEWFAYEPEKEQLYLAGAAAGLAPLEDTPYASCKGGYKVKTYLAAGIPTVASPVGHHKHLIRSGENGILAKTADEWMDALSKMLSDPAFARRLGMAARESAVANYSHEVLMPIWAEQLRAALPQVNARTNR